MASKIDNLVRRQVKIFDDVLKLSAADLDFLANGRPEEAPSSRDENQARRLLRGLVRMGNLITGASVISTDELSGKPSLIPALPGFFAISVKPNPDGSFDREEVQKEPVVAWSVLNDFAVPITVSAALTERWAVLTPEGFVITDPITNLFGEAPLKLRDWIKSEIEWLQDQGLLYEYPRAHSQVFEYNGPVAKALGSLMHGRPYWLGTVEQLFLELTEFRRDKHSELPSDPGAMMGILKALEPKLADAALTIHTVDDGRVCISRFEVEE